MTASSARQTGTLYIVATPIGNRDDLTFRALSTLKAVDVILAEDTRHSMQLLSSLGIKKPMSSLHEHNEDEKSNVIIDGLLMGKSYALISDAGTPLISDPGYTLVRKAKANQIEVVPIPGACAFITALQASGIACDSVSFFGFLPAKQNARRDKLASLTKITHTIIFYESTHRILECINDIIEIFGDSIPMVLAKELTKTFERIISAPAKDILKWLNADTNHTKGEFVLLIPPRLNAEEPGDNDRILNILLEELPLKQAVKIAAELTGSAKNDLYTRALEIKNQGAT